MICFDNESKRFTAKDAFLDHSASECVVFSCLFFLFLHAKRESLSATLMTERTLNHPNNS